MNKLEVRTRHCGTALHNSLRVLGLPGHINGSVDVCYNIN